MNSLIFVVLAINISCSITARIEDSKVIRRLLERTTTKSDEIQTPVKHFSSSDPYSIQNSVKFEELEKIADTKVDPSNRKSKILSSLAFLAGLSVGGLAGAASSDIKTYAKLPALSVNVGASQISPQIAAIYDPYSYTTHPYVLAAPLGFYSLVDPLRLQSINEIRNSLQPLTQNLLNNKPTDLQNNNEEYVDEAKRIENVKTSSNADKDTYKGAELQAEDDRNAEEKIPYTACNAQKEINSKHDTSVKNIFRQRENADGSLMILGSQAINTTQRATSTNRTNRNTTEMPSTTSRNAADNLATMNPVQNPPKNPMMQNPPMNPMMQNPPLIDNQTNPPFYGYYGGYPQNVNHIDLTTEPYVHKYHGYEQINYNVPLHDKPVNFYSDERYNYYPAPPVDSYPISQFHQEQIPEYLSNDFKRFLYTPDSRPVFTNSDFRPVA